MSEKLPDPSVCVIVLNYNGHQHLEYCLPSIFATEYNVLTVLLVDNASSDGSVEFVRQHYPMAQIIASPVNRGWSGVNNLGIEYARRIGAKYVILANNDIRVDPRWVSAAVKVAQQDPQIGIVGFRILEPRGADRDAGFTRAVAEWSDLEINEPRWVDGMAMFFRTSVFEHIGLIDEGFFVYGEDNDLERRARKAGYHVVGTNVAVWHFGQGFFGKVPLRAGKLQIRNDLRLSLKHDNLFGVLYQVALHFVKGCLPFVKIDRSDPVARRLHPSNIFVNFGILLYAIGWNIWHLPATLRRRHEDNQRALEARHQWEET
jgi:glycosyltransferase involved in cell wall biosynthesis